VLVEGFKLSHFLFIKYHFLKILSDCLEAYINASCTERKGKEVEEFLSLN
jgi:hypothetical protein